MFVVSKDSPLAAEALERFRGAYGIDPVEALPDDHWAVALVNGRPEVVLNAKGVRALGLLSPMPGAQQVAEDVIAHRPGMPGPVS